jgi:hypothetical protein
MQDHIDELKRLGIEAINDWLLCIWLIKYVQIFNLKIFVCFGMVS